MTQHIFPDSLYFSQIENLVTRNISCYDIFSFGLYISLKALLMVWLIKE
ncbi:hypothetical protein JCM19274_102 [Algibacter lectus]|uniref:Uncharacterized protein n=1 Tax=Algibacter lectus TaxID=221126 RepID=A0A090X6V1_9FLAO|nr:hypothetical protein JCM19274_102 [Algibacter lectus]